MSKPSELMTRLTFQQRLTDTSGVAQALQDLTDAGFQPIAQFQEQLGPGVYQYVILGRKEELVLPQPELPDPALTALVQPAGTLRLVPAPD